MKWVIIVIIIIIITIIMVIISSRLPSGCIRLSRSRSQTNIFCSTWSPLPRSNSCTPSYFSPSQRFFSKHRGSKLTMWEVIFFFLKYLRKCSAKLTLTWPIYRRHVLLPNDRVWLRETWPTPSKHMAVLCYNGFNLQRFVWGKNG